MKSFGIVERIQKFSVILDSVDNKTLPWQKQNTFDTLL
jgi:hypothetical protein